MSDTLDGTGALSPTPPLSPRRLRRTGRTGWRGLRLVTLLAVALCLVTAGAATAAPAAPTATPQIVDSTRSGGYSVALTFDDGPNPADTPRLLEILRQNNVTAVFCLWGTYAQQYPYIVQQIVADGHVLCNHTMAHEDLGYWSPDQIRQNLEQTNAAIQSAVPGAEIPYFRAPNGNWGQSPQVAADLGMQPLGWRLAINDWEPATSDQLLDRLRQGVTPGAVVLLHDGGGDRSATVDAVSRYIPEIRSQGWTLDLPALP
jgi:peptidoglycan/xylan/chitin deacetylase (PgdA/CDA1 family)